MAASWECPSLPMLSLPLKDSAKISFLGLKPFISAHYEENPDTFSEEIRQLDQLREHAMRPSKDYNGCSVMRRYFAQLHLLRARFPPETLGQIPVDFVWKDAFNGTEYLQEGLQIEQASMLYNIAALHAQLGSHGKRDTEQEMKEAVTHFQCSAGAFNYLNDHFAINHASKDLSPDFVSFYSNLMLGQAQECLVEKSLKGIGRVKNVTIARLSTRVSEFYSRCFSLVEGGACNAIAKKNKDWSKLLKFKVLYFQAISHFYQGGHAEELGKYGELIALIQLAIQKLGTITGKPPKGMGDVMKIARQNFADHMNEKLVIAKRQNEQVYHDTIPQTETLELVSGADLVKPVSFHPTDPKNLGTDIFSRLIPMRAHEVASIYSEEKAKLMRSVISSVEEKDEELEQFMRSLNATEVEKIHDGPPAIPDNVLQMHQSLQGKGEEVRRLHSSCQELMAMSRCVEEDFTAIEEMKKREETEEEQFQSQYGVRPVSQVCSGLWKEMENYHKYNTQASKSNTELKAMFDQHYPNLVLLTSPLASLKASLPKMTLLDTPAEDTSESERWEHLLKEVEKMTKQRQMLVSRFREQMSHDDITKNLVGHLGNDQEMFMEDHMRQFKEIANVIRQNLAAQENILNALTEANAKKASTRQTVQEIAQQQQAMFARLIKSGGFVNLLQTKIQEGIGFYRKLQGSVSRLKKRAEEVCDARQRERQSIERQKMPATPESPSPSAPSPSLPHGTSPPVRPPKKAELAGKPLLPDQPSLPPLDPQHTPPPMSPGHSGGGLGTEQQTNPNSIPSSGMQVIQGVPFNANLPTTQLELQELQRIQMQQQSQLDEVKIPPGGPPTGEPQIAEDSSPAVDPPHVQTEPTEMPQTVTSPSQSVPDATLALNNLQLLLHAADPSLNKPLDAGLIHTDLGEGGDKPVTDTSQVPQRPPKPSHLKSGLLPSPFPSLPPPSEQNTQPSGSPLNSTVEPPQSNIPSGPLPSEHPMLPIVSSAPINLYPTASSALEGGRIPASTENLQPNDKVVGLPPPLQPLSNDHPGGSSQGSLDITLGATPPWTGGSDNMEKTHHDMDVSSKPHATIPAEVFTTQQQQVPSQEGLISSIQPPLSAEPVPYYQPNINIQPGEITLTTSSILGPIPSAQAIPSSPESLVTPSVPPLTSVVSEVTPAMPILESSVLELAQSLMSGGQQSGDVNVSAPSVEQPTAVTTSTTPIQPQYTQPDDATTTESGGFSIIVDGRELATSQSPADGTQVSEPTPESTEQNAFLTKTEHQSSMPIPPNLEPPPGRHTLPTMGTPVVQTAGLIGIPVSMPNSEVSSAVPNSPANLTDVSTAIDVPSLELMASNTMVGNLPSVVPLPLTSLSSLTTPLTLETPIDTTPLTTELAMGHLLQQEQPMSEIQVQLLQQSVEDQKKVIEMHKTEKETYKVREAAYRQQIGQLQQQLNMLQQKQDQEKAAASDQHSALMQLLHQQQGMFSQQQSQIEKLSQLDESHRKEYLEVEEKFRETLKAEQGMKASLQEQILQLTQENQKLNQTIQVQVQQVQALQLQLQQYSVHIQERDKQLVAFKDQHKQIVDKLEQRNQQKFALLMQKIQELQLELSQRPKGPPSLPQPIQPTVVMPQRQLNPQQSQDLGPAGPQPNLPHPIQPNILQAPTPGRVPLNPIQQSGSIQNASLVRPGSVPPMTVAPPPQGVPGPTRGLIPPHPASALPPPSQPMQPSNVPLQLHQRNTQLQGQPQTQANIRPPSAAPSPLPAPLPQHRMGIQAVSSDNTLASPSSKLQTHVQPVVDQIRPASIPSQPQPPFGGVPKGPPPSPLAHHMAPPGGSKVLVTPPSHMSTLPQPVMSPRPPQPPLQSQVSFPGNVPHQQQQDIRMHPSTLPQQPVVFQSPSDPTLQMRPQQVVPQSVRQEMVPMSVPLQVPPGHISGPRFPVQGGPGAMRPNPIPGSLPSQQLPGVVVHPHYRPGAGLHPEYRGRTP